MNRIFIFFFFSFLLSMSPGLEASSLTPSKFCGKAGLLFGVGAVGAATCDQYRLAAACACFSAGSLFLLPMAEIAFGDNNEIRNPWNVFPYQKIIGCTALGFACIAVGTKCIRDGL